MFDYSLDVKDYTWKNALCWGNFLGHCKKAGVGSCGNRLIHILIAIAELFPIVSQIASVFEKVIVTNFDKSADPIPLPSLAPRTVSKVALKQDPKIQDVAVKKLKGEKVEGQKSAAATPPVSETRPEAQPTRIIKPFACELSFHDYRKPKQPIQIQQESDIEAFLKIVEQEVCPQHQAVRLYFKYGTSDEEILATMHMLQTFPAAQALQFSISTYANRSIDIRPKPVKSEEIGHNTTRFTYANGVMEDFLSDAPERRRIFPDGTTECGEFSEANGSLAYGYRITADRQIEYIDPKPLASYGQRSKGKRSEFLICDVEGELVVLEKTVDKETRNSKYTRSDVPIEAVLLKADERQCYGVGKGLMKVLVHQSFAKQRQSFIESLLVSNETDAPKLFMLSNTAILDVLEVGKLDPLTIMDPVSKRSALAHIAHYCKDKWSRDCLPLFSRMEKLFPAQLVAAGQNIVDTLLLQGHPIAGSVAKICSQLGTVFDPYHQLWLKIAAQKHPDVQITQDLSLLSPEQQHTLYEAAFLYNNPFIYEPAERAITPAQYSINLMWINEEPMHPSQQFLFGTGYNDETRELDFQKRFVVPVSNWAKKNPGSVINIWVDGAMATREAIERSRTALEKALEGTAHGTIQFRDVRSIDVVQKNPDAFTKAIPVYFRVDLLRAAAADFTLRKKETQFFVYGDIDMQPLSAAELFDKRTVRFLDDLGFVMAKGGHLGFENGFQILNGAHPQFLDSHRQVIVDLSIEMTLEKPHAIKEQQIYDTYPAMITHLLDAKGTHGKAMLHEEEPPCAYELRDYRYDRFSITAHDNLPLGDKGPKLKEVMPRKPVQLPPSHF